MTGGNGGVLPAYASDKWQAAASNTHADRTNLIAYLLAKGWKTEIADKSAIIADGGCVQSRIRRPRCDTATHEATILR
jgi:hypothetical protein